MARNTTVENYDSTYAGHAKRAKPRLAIVRLEGDWIDCDVHLGLEVHYVGYLCAMARLGR